jgi:hypothetical protein
MPKVSPLQSNFGGGEFSPLAKGRVDAERYRTGLELCINAVSVLQGAQTRRPASKFAAETKLSSTRKARLIPFEFSVTQAYMLEFGHEYIRFYRNDGQIIESTKTITGVTQANPAVVTSVAHGYTSGQEVYIDGIVGMTQLNGRNFKVTVLTADTFSLQYMDATNVNSTAFTAYTSGGTAARVYTVATGYQEEDLFAIKFVQSADILYLVHPDYKPQKLSRTGHTSWTLTTIDFRGGPFGFSASGTEKITPSATTGTGITLTATVSQFVSTDVGRLVRLRHSSTWGWAKITGYTSATVVTADVISDFAATTGSDQLMMGIWSDTTGYPATVTFHEDRLFFAGVEALPSRIDGSYSGDYENFQPTETNGTTTDAHAMSFTLNANDVNVARWLASEEKGLLGGTVSGEWLIRPSSQSEALTPTNVSAKRITTYGSANLQPTQIGKATLFLQRSSRKLRELAYTYEVDGYRAPDLTLLANHVSESGFVQFAYQKEPYSIIWAVRNDGVLCSMVYERDESGLKAGWHRHIWGGVSDAASNPAIVESVACIPSSDGTYDEVWVIVKRRINGGVKRYVEYMTKFFEDTDDQQDAFFLDGGLTYNAPITVTGATRANPIVVTAPTHGLSNLDEVIFNDIQGMTELNGNIYKVSNKTANTFELQIDGTNVNSTSFTAYVSGGKVRKRVQTISGLWHLEGQTPDVLGDGADLGSVTVTNGSITLPSKAAVVQIGLGYNSDGKMLRLEAGSADGTALGKTRRTNRIGFYLHRTLGLKFGMNFTEMQTLPFRDSSTPASQATPLFTGIISENIEADYDFDNQICWRQNRPFPMTVLAVMPQMTTQDR